MIITSPNAQKDLLFRPWFIALAFVSALTAGQAIAFIFLRPRLSASQPPTTPSQHSLPIPATITALGRLEPQGEVIQLSASNSAQSGSNRVAQLLVKQGDKVRTGQVVAILDNRDRLLVALEQARAQVKVAQARLAQVKAGAKTGEVRAQQATITQLRAELHGEVAAQRASLARFKAELGNAQSEYWRYQELHRAGAISTLTFDLKRLAVETISKQIDEAKASLSRTEATLQAQIDEAKANLNRIEEVRPVDVQVAQAEVNNAIASVKQAQADLNLAYVYSPINGQVLKIHTWPGEVVSNQGIVDLGQTEQMYVVAEVYESDIVKVHLGQHAMLMSDANPMLGKLHGTVDQIGLQIGKKDVLNTDPSADVDARVVEVKIRLDPADSSRVAGLTNMKMIAAINIAGV